MPWTRLFWWLTTQRRSAGSPAMPLTLMTLVIDPDASRDELAFYAEAEMQALVKWAELGRVVLAFMASDHDSITLVCTEPVEAMLDHAASLPLVTAGLATVSAHGAVLLKLGEAPRAWTH